MNINNIAIVRAMDADLIPFDGTIHPISDVPYIKKNINSNLASEIKRLLEKEGVFPPMDWEKFGDVDYMNNRNSIINNIVSNYIPYSSSYNSMVLFALNGLVPDDSERGFGNNTFSNKPCAVIDGLSEQINQVVSLVPTDTALKGTVTLSDNAIILIKEEVYEALPIDKKDQLKNLNCQFKTFNGDLKNAVSEYLKNSNRFVLENLTLTKEHGWILPSETSELTKKTINQIANDRNIAQDLHLDILFHKTDNMDKLQSVKDDYENYFIVNEYYMRQFFAYLFKRINIDDYLKYNLLNKPLNETYTEELVEQIKDLGIEKYKKIVEEYNLGLEKMKLENLLPTPNQIVQSVRENRAIPIADFIANYNKEAVLEARQFDSSNEQLNTEEINNEINSERKGIRR